MGKVAATFPCLSSSGAAPASISDGELMTDAETRRDPLVEMSENVIATATQVTARIATTNTLCLCTAFLSLNVVWDTLNEFITCASSLRKGVASGFIFKQSSEGR